jgi:hypothetical protein
VADRLDTAQALYEDGHVLRAADLLRGERGLAEQSGDAARATEIDDLVTQMRQHLGGDELRAFDGALAGTIVTPPVGKQALLGPREKRALVAALALLAISVPNAGWLADRLRGDGGGRPAGPRDAPAADPAAAYDQIRVGMTTLQVRGILGEPDSRQNIQGGGGTLECWYYGDATAALRFQFCFDGTTLQTKAEY